MTSEPFLEPDPSRCALFPIKHQHLYDMYLKHVKMFWHSGEIDFKEDVQDWKDKLSEQERKYISHVLAFFASAENSVMDNLALRFMKDVPVREVQHFYAVQLFMESVHSETYSRIIDVLLGSMDASPDEIAAEKKRLFEAVNTVETIKAKTEWAKKWIDDNEASFAERLLAFICMEGIGFIGSFVSIFWLKKRGLLPGLTFSNDLISRDESLHRLFGIEVYRMLTHKLDRKRIIEIVTSFVDLELNFVQEALDVALIGMNQKDMCEYIRFIADYLLQELGQAPHYGAKNPFDWMMMQGMSDKNNFFEKRTTNYQKSVSEKTFTTDLSVFD
jgi:ribonucleotide reductase beta subunit family protein with ferritin-like domain